MSAVRRVVRASAVKLTPHPFLPLQEGEVTNCPRPWGGGQGVGAIFPKGERLRSPFLGKWDGGKDE